MMNRGFSVNCTLWIITKFAGIGGKTYQAKTERLGKLLTLGQAQLVQTLGLGGKLGRPWLVAREEASREAGLGQLERGWSGSTRSRGGNRRGQREAGRVQGLVADELRDSGEVLGGRTDGSGRS